MTVNLTANARRRLQQIRAYYTLAGNSKKGRKVTQAILKEAKKLEDYPYLGQEEELLESLGLEHRYLLVDRLYKIIYFITGTNLFITDIFDTRQDPSKMKG